MDEAVRVSSHSSKRGGSSSSSVHVLHQAAPPTAAAVDGNGGANNNNNNNNNNNKINNAKGFEFGAVKQGVREGKAVELATCVPPAVVACRQSRHALTQHVR
jgi:hypothetical protein